MANIKATQRNDVTTIRRNLQRNTDLAVLGQTSDASSPVFVNDRPGYWWVRFIQAGGTYGPAVQVRGCLQAMTTTPGTTVKMGIVEGEKAVIGIDFVSATAQGVNPTQAAVVDPNANNPAFVNQAFIATAFEQILEGTLKVGLRGAVPLAAGVFVKVEGQFDFTGNVPSAGSHCLAMTAIQSDLATTETQYSTAKSTGIPLDLDDLNEAWALMSDPTTNKPLWSWDIGDGQTALIEANRWMDNRQFLNWESSGGGSGDVVGPASAVDSDFAQFNTTTGKLIKDGGLSLSTDGTFSANSDSLIPSQKAAKTYTDNAVQNAINGLAPKADLALWTNAALPAVTYSNGSSGVGATLIAVSTGVLTVDGVAVTLGMRIGVKDQAAQLQNGLYVVTTAGALGVAFVLTRTTDANTSAELLGAYAFALQGTVNADTAFLCSNSSAITIGTTAITFVKFQGAGINQLTGDVTAGPGTGSQAATLATVNSNVGTFSRVKSITANAKGLITAITQGLVDLASEVTGLLPLANGGTGADLSATGPGVLVQASSAAAVSIESVLNQDLVNWVFKSQCVTVSTTNINIASAPGTIGGKTYTSGNQRILLTGQSTGSQNGIWIWTGAGNALTRPTDYATGLVIPAQQGLMVFVQSGTNKATFWQFQSLSSATVDTTSISFSLVNSTVMNMLQSTDQTDTLFGFKCLVDAVADTNLNIASAPSSIDGVPTNVGAIRALLTNQSTLSQNGLWLVASGQPMVRPTDYASGYAFAFSQGITVEAGTGGTTYKNTRWRCTTAPTVTVDTTSTAWAQIVVALAAIPNLPASIITSGTLPISTLKVYLAAIIGDGSDGAFSASSGTTTLSRDMYWTDITLTGTAKINTAGYRIFHTGKLDQSNAGAGSIFNDGGTGGNASSGTGGSGGTAPSSNTVGGGGLGPVGANGRATSGAGTNGTPGVASSPGNGGAGGDGGNGGAGTGGAGGTAQTGGAVSSGLSIHRWLVDTLRGASLLLGGASGASGSSGGSNGAQSGGGGQAGSGAGVVYISGWEYARGGSTATGAISAKGGLGGNGASSAGAANGDGGGGGGGGGGWIIGSWFVFSGSAATNNFDASGGAGGNAGAAGGTLATVASGGNGAAGGRITLINMSTGVVTETTGSAGTAHSGRTGGAGNTFQASL